MSSCGHELLQWLLYYFPSSCRSPSPITGLFPQDSYSTFPSPLITQLFINSEQFVCVCGGCCTNSPVPTLFCRGMSQMAARHTILKIIRGSAASY